MDKPVMIRNFFDKIEKVTTAPTMPTLLKAAFVAPDEVSYDAPVAVAAAAAKAPSFDDYIFSYSAPLNEEHNLDCPPLTAQKSPAARAAFNDYGVGLPPMSGSYN